MRSPITAIALTLCLVPAAVAGESRHPLIGEPPAPMRPGKSTETTIAGQPRSQAVLAALLTGLPVYDSDRRELGDVTAVLFAGDGTVEALLVRMGGSSGLAGRDVALPLDLVTVATRSDGTAMILVESRS